LNLTCKVRPVLYGSFQFSFSLYASTHTCNQYFAIAKNLNKRS